MRQMVGLSALTDCAPDVLTALLSPVFQQRWSGNNAI
jgi:hypothetical protein